MAKKSNEVIAVDPDYVTKINAFVEHLQTVTGESFASSAGRKFDKVFKVVDMEKKCAFMVRRSDGSIFGTKSWVMINYRRTFGTIDTVSEWVWTTKRPKPLENTPSAVAHSAREAELAKSYGPRGRPRKVLASN